MCGPLSNLTSNFAIMFVSASESESKKTKQTITIIVTEGIYCMYTGMA